MAGALAYALLIRVGDHPAQHSAEQVVTVTAIGMIVGALPHLAVGRPARVTGMAARLLCVACVAVHLPPAGRTARRRSGNWGPAFSLMAALVVLALLLEAVITALMRVGRAAGQVPGRAGRRDARPAAARRGGRARRPCSSRSPPRSWGWRRWPCSPPRCWSPRWRSAGTPGSGPPTCRRSARWPGHRDRRVRGAGPLRAGEPAGGRRRPGARHATSRSCSSSSTPRSCTTSASCRSRDPIPGGATVLVSRQEQQRIAELGAEVIEQARVLGSVAEIVRRQNEPYRRRGGHEGYRAPAADRPASRPAAAEQPHHPGRQRLRRPGGQLAGPGPGGGGGAAAPAGHGQRVRPRAVEALSRVVNRRSVIRL